MLWATHTNPVSHDERCQNLVEHAVENLSKVRDRKRHAEIMEKTQNMEAKMHQKSSGKSSHFARAPRTTKSRREKYPRNITKLFQMAAQGGQGGIRGA